MTATLTPGAHPERSGGGHPALADALPSPFVGADGPVRANGPDRADRPVRAHGAHGAHEAHGPAGSPGAHGFPGAPGAPGAPGSPGSPGSPDTDGPLGDEVTRATDLLAGVVSTLDPGRLTGRDAALLYRMFAAVERLAMAGKTLLAPRIDESGVWRDGGHRSPAVMLAELEGVPTGQARNTLEVGRRLPDLPGTEEALRSGALSGPKAVELSGAAVLDPGNEGVLLAGAADQPLQKIRERCQRARSTAERHDPVAAVRRIHAARSFASWTDADGAFCYQGKDTADRGARILEQMQHTVGRLRAAANERTPSTPGGADRAPVVEPDRALRADAFYLLLTGRSLPGGPPGATPAGRPLPPATTAEGPTPDGPGSERPGADDLIDGPPTCSVMVRVDLDALLRGDVAPGEVCDIDNQGPIPVAMARDLASDSFLRIVFHQAGDIRAVSHFGRTVNRRLRTALVHRDRCCVVPGCGVPFGLEIDHVVPFAEGGPTELDNLALLCHHHHYLKTYEGWTLQRVGRDTDGSPTWVFAPQPPLGQEPDPPGG